MQSTHKTINRSRTGFEALEVRQLLSADISLFAAGGVVQIEGDNNRSAIQVSVTQETLGDVKVVNSGTTSVFLDTATLEAAANLVVSSINSTGTPASAAFQAGFPILNSSDFRFTTGGFAPVDGTIKHEGTVGFNGDSIIVGDFDIKFDAQRISATTSGFYVANTVDGALDDLILFDVGNPGGLSLGASSLDIFDADLLVSPEFAAILSDPAFAGVDLTGADVGNAQINAETAHFISGGATSVFLDLATLSAAANLNVTDIYSSGEPFSGDFQVGFPVLESSDFRYSTDGGLSLLGGTIRHEGTVTFNDAVTVGDFDITAVAGRADANNSGLVVVSTAPGALNGLILFDIGNPGGLTADADGLTVSGADLRVSPEFAAVLADPVFAGADLTGAVVGNARVDAVAGQVTQTTVDVKRKSHHTTVNGQRADSVTVNGLETINIDLKGGKDYVKVSHSDFKGDLNIDLGDGRNSALVYGVDILGEIAVIGGHSHDTLSLYKASSDRLSIKTGDGRDQVRLTHSQVRGDAVIDTGDDRDLLRVLSSHFAGESDFSLGNGRDAFRSLFSDYRGQTNIDGGGGRDSFVSIFDEFDDLDRSGFERTFTL